MTQAPDLGAVPRRPWQRLLVGGLLPAGIKIANAGLGYLTTLIAAWLLSPAEYGLFGAVIAFSLLCSFALSYGQPVAMIKFYHEQLVASGERAADRQLSWSLLVGGSACCCAPWPAPSGCLPARPTRAAWGSSCCFACSFLPASCSAWRCGSRSGCWRRWRRATPCGGRW
ncbi:oligosaccharide flippase family protein [Aeromonas media]|nr:oligosaccharide flippase family protein [Aeromonas media]